MAITQKERDELYRTLSNMLSEELTKLRKTATYQELLAKYEPENLKQLRELYEEEKRLDEIISEANRAKIILRHQAIAIMNNRYTHLPIGHVIDLHLEGEVAKNAHKQEAKNPIVQRIEMLEAERKTLEVSIYQITSSKGISAAVTKVREMIGNRPSQLEKLFQEDSSSAENE